MRQSKPTKSIYIYKAGIFLVSFQKWGLEGWCPMARGAVGGGGCVWSGLAILSFFLVLLYYRSLNSCLWGDRKVEGVGRTQSFPVNSFPLFALFLNYILRILFLSRIYLCLC